MNYNENFINNKVMPYVKLNNKSNDLPYHNLKHLLIVYDMCKNYIDNNNDIFYPNELLVAALFHDFNHTGMQPDQQNIDKAIDALTIFHNDYPDFFDLTITSNIIKSTIFEPNKTETKTLSTLEECVINDADIGVYFTENLKDLELALIGLAKEFGVPMIDFINNTFVFIDKLNFKTDYFRNIWNGGIKEKTIINLTYIRNKYDRTS
jgi:hypothetical protein